MNGEVSFVCRLTSAARNAIKTGVFSFERLPYESNISFVFCGRKTALGEIPEYIAKTPEEWFGKLKEDNVTDVFMMMPYAVEDRNRLGFVNTSGCTVFVKLKSGHVSRFLPQWILDKVNNRWSVVVHEDLMEEIPSELPTFKDNTDRFRAVLTNIAKFAEHIGEQQFAEYFKKGAAVLSGGNTPTILEGSGLPKLSDQNMRLYLAADISDVFGAMGSWNDSPAYKAHEMGLDEDYEKLSAALLSHNRLALMYAINED